MRTIYLIISIFLLSNLVYSKELKQGPFNEFVCVSEGYRYYLKVDLSLHPVKRKISLIDLETFSVRYEAPYGSFQFDRNGYRVFSRTSNHGGPVTIFSAEKITPLKSVSRGNGMGLRDAICEIL